MWIYIKNSCLFLILFWMIGGSHVTAETGGKPKPLIPPGIYNFKTFGPDQGLTNTSVTDLVCDRDGRIWVGTEDGLYCQEGQRFRRYSVEDGLPSSLILFLTAPREGGIWALTQLGAVFWNGSKFQQPSELGILNADQDLSNPYSHEDIIPLKDYGIIFAKGDSPCLVTGQTEVRSFPELKNLIHPPVWMSPNGKEMLFFTHKEFIFWQEGKLQRQPIPDSILKSGTPVALIRSSKGILWIRTTGALFMQKGFDAAPESVSHGISLGMPNYGVDISEDVTGTILTGSSQGLFWSRDGQSGWLNQTNGLLETGGSFCLVFDKEGNLWVSTDALLMQQGRLLWSNYTRQQGLPANMVWRVARGPDNRLWAATQSGLAKMEDDRWVTMPDSENRIFYGLASDPSGSLWVCGDINRSEKPFLLEMKSGETWPHRVPLLGVVPSTLIYEIAFDSGGNLWLISREAGLLCGRRSPNGWMMEKMPIPGWESVTNFQSMIVGPESSLWIGSDVGVAIRDRGTWQLFRGGQGIPRGMVAVIKASPSGDVWVSCAGTKELTVFRKVEGRWKIHRRFQSPHPLVQDTILAIDFEPDGTLMLGTNRGVVRWSKGQFERYGREWGLTGEDCAQGGLWYDPNGDWWVATSAGISRFDRSRYHHPPSISPVRIHRVVDGQGRTLLLGKQPPQISYHHAHLTFHFSPNGYLGAAKGTLQFRLQGIEDNWQNAESSVAVYPSLAGGHYLFETRMRGWDGTFGPITALAFEILPPWYQTWWARIVFFLIGMTLIWGGLVLRTYRLKTSNQRLETMVKTRTTELAAQAKDLENTNDRFTQANADLTKALAEVKTLRGLIPICSYCKKIRNDEGFWNQLESYISQHTEAYFSHSICPDCLEKLKKDL